MSALLNMPKLERNERLEDISSLTDDRSPSPPDFTKKTNHSKTARKRLEFVEWFSESQPTANIRHPLGYASLTDPGG